MAVVVSRQYRASTQYLEELTPVPIWIIGTERARQFGDAEEAETLMRSFFGDEADGFEYHEVAEKQRRKKRKRTRKRNREVKNG